MSCLGRNLRVRLLKDRHWAGAAPAVVPAQVGARALVEVLLVRHQAGIGSSSRLDRVSRGAKEDWCCRT